MASFTPVDTPARPEPINNAAENINRVGDAVTGHGGLVMGVMHQTASHFSDIIAEQVKRMAGYNEDAFRAAVIAIGYGAGVTHTWAQNVTDFRTKRQQLIDEWNTAQSSGFGVDPVIPGLVAGEAATQHKDGAQALRDAYQHHDASVAAAGSAKAQDLYNRFKPIYEQFMHDAGDRGSELKRDPTDADLRRFATAGTLPWAAYLAAPPSANIPPPVTAADGNRAGQIAERVARGEHVDPKDLAWALGLLDQVNKYIVDNGVATAGQLAFLGAFYKTLGPDLSKIAGKIKDLPDLSAEQKHLYNQQIADGLLNLGNEKVGGSYQALPESVRKVLEDDPTVLSGSGDDSGRVRLGLVNEEGWRGLSDLLEHASPQAQGGDEFSNRLTHQVAKIVDAYGQVNPGKGVDGAGLFGDRSALSGQLEHLVDVSTRNIQANHDVIVGPDGADVYKKLIGFEWNDDGRAASGLTDWIARNAQHAHDSGHEDPLANDAAAHLIEFVTNGHFADGSSAGTYLRGVGLNPEFGRSLGDIAEVHVGAFAVPAADGDSTSVVDGHLQISAADRKDFLTVIGANQNALKEFGAAAGRYETALYNDPNISDAGAGVRTRILYDTLYGAQLETLHQQHVTNAQDVAAHQGQLNQSVNAGKALLGTVVGYVPGVGPLLGGVIDFTGDQWKDAISNASPGEPAGDLPDVPPADAGSNEAGFAERFYDQGRTPDAHIPPDLLSGEVKNGVPQLRHDLSAVDRARLLDALYTTSQHWKDYKLGAAH